LGWAGKARPERMRVYARYAILNGQPDSEPEPIEIYVYEPDPEKPGCLRHVRNRTIREVYEDLVSRLKAEDLLPDEYFNISSYEVVSWKRGDLEFPRYRAIACFPVTGASEGHYIHVGALVERTDVKPPLVEFVPVFMGKTFQGFEFAAAVVAACAKHLGA